MSQSLINWAFSLCGIMIGFFMRTLWQSIKDLQTADKDLIDRVHSVEKVVAGDYVTKDDFHKIVTRLFDKLEEIQKDMRK